MPRRRRWRSSCWSFHFCCCSPSTCCNGAPADITDMAATVSSLGIRRNRRRPTTESLFVRWLLIGIALAFLGILLVVPLVAVFVNAFSKGVGYYFHTLADPLTLASIKMTFIAAAVAVPLNCI